MSIKRLTITKLFGQFDYDIPLDNPEGIRIITGPNGYGKTMILKILDSVFNQRFDFFETLVFETIIIEISSDARILIEHNSFNNGKTFYSIYHKDELIEKVFGQVYKQNYAKPHFIEDISKEIFKTIKSRLVSVDRLEKTPEESSSHNKVLGYYAEKLYSLINKISNDSTRLKNQLDTTYPIRMMSEAKDIDETAFKHRFDGISKKQEKLVKYSIMENEQVIPEYNAQNARLLSVYLEDTEKKIGIFDDLLLKLDIFTNTINSHKFSNKILNIVYEDLHSGKFTFITQNDTILHTDNLSTGEQNLIVLLYELIFNTQPNTLLLIDEPEISLHVAWQHSFIDDLVEIMKLQKMQIIVATHSPQIISTYGDLAYDLYYSQQKSVEI